MIDHMTFRVSDIHKTKSFYTGALAPLGYSLVFDKSFDGVNIVGYGQADPAAAHGHTIDTWFVDGPSPYGGHATTTGCHLCAGARPTAPPLTRFTTRRSLRAAATMAHPACGRCTTPTTTAPL